MAAGGSTQQSFRKALGALKDSTKVGLVKVNSAHKQLDVAIVKATNHFEVIPKEKHIRSELNLLLCNLLVTFANKVFGGLS
ncbi:hypothetical protein LguiB_005216 [Lonicera macranthoides]